MDSGRRLRMRMTAVGRIEAWIARQVGESSVGRMVDDEDARTFWWFQFGNTSSAKEMGGGIAGIWGCFGSSDPPVQLSERAIIRWSGDGSSFCSTQAWCSWMDRDEANVSTAERYDTN